MQKCDGNPPIYGIEDGRKRWIVDLAIFKAEGYVWEDVRIVQCDALRALPDGESMPPGNPPPPLTGR